MNKIRLKSTVRAKECIDCFLTGTNPFTNQELEDSAIIVDEKLRACFSYISDILEIAIIRHDKIDECLKIKDISVSEIEKQIPFSDSPVSLTEFTRRINSVLSTTLGIELKPAVIAKWLVKNNILQLNGKRSVLGPRSEELEITTERRTNMRGLEYIATLYGIKAQKFIVENITEILLEERL